MIKTIKIVRGPPGTGKTTEVAKIIAQHGKEPDEISVCSADNYFEEVAALNNTTYREEFKPWLVGKAHQHCWGSFIHAICVMEEELVFVDNTNTYKWEYENFVFLAELNGYVVDIIEIPFDAEKAEVYYERNTHGVPLEVIERMIREYEPEG